MGRLAGEAKFFYERECVHLTQSIICSKIENNVYNFGLGVYRKEKKSYEY